MWGQDSTDVFPVKEAYSLFGSGRFKMAYIPQNYVYFYPPEMQLVYATGSSLPQHDPFAKPLAPANEKKKVPFSKKFFLRWPWAAVTAGLLALLSLGIYEYKRVTSPPPEPLPPPGLPMPAAQTEEIQSLCNEFVRTFHRFLNLSKDCSQATKNLFVSLHMRVAEDYYYGVPALLLDSYAQAFRATQVPETDTEALVYKTKCQLLSAAIQATTTRLTLMQERAKFVRKSGIPSAYLGVTGRPLAPVTESAETVSLRQLFKMASVNVRDSENLPGLEIPKVVAQRLADILLDRDQHLSGDPEEIDACFRPLRDHVAAFKEQVTVFVPLEKRPLNVSRFFEKLDALNGWRKSKAITNEQVREMAMGWKSSDDILKTIEILEQEEHALIREEKALKQKMKDELATKSSAKQFIQVLVDLV